LSANRSCAELRPVRLAFGFDTLGIDLPGNGLANKQTRPHIASPIKVNFMADVANKYPENTGGKYYVDNQCIDCDLCRETAPDNFKRNDDGGYSFVYKQPENPEEEARCKEAKEGCPVEAIGDNGG
jgi:ferredoxin